MPCRFGGMVRFPRLSVAVALTVSVVAGCGAAAHHAFPHRPPGSSRSSSHIPRFRAPGLRRPGSAGCKRRAVLLSPSQVAFLTSGGTSCAWWPARLTVLGPSAIRSTCASTERDRLWQRRGRVPDRREDPPADCRSLPTGDRPAGVQGGHVGGDTNRRNTKAVARPLMSKRSGPGLVDPPASLTVDVAARVVAEVRCAEDEELETVRPRLEATPHPGGTRTASHSASSMISSSSSSGHCRG